MRLLGFGLAAAGFCFGLWFSYRWYGIAGLRRAFEFRPSDISEDVKLFPIAFAFGFVFAPLLDLCMHLTRKKNQRALEKPTTTTFEYDVIRFMDWGNDLDGFIQKIERALGVGAKKRKFLVFVLRCEFVIDGESLVLFIDEDGTAFLDMKDVSAGIKERVTDRIRQSDQFRELMAERVE
jgi:hypothetical protein